MESAKTFFPLVKAELARFFVFFQAYGFWDVISFKREKYAYICKSLMAKLLSDVSWRAFCCKQSLPVNCGVS